MLESFHNILKDAFHNHYGVGAFNCLGVENVIGAIDAAEELRSPIILQLAEVQFPTAPLELMIPIFIEKAKQATVPVCVHLDHGLSYETCARAVRLGCNSVMIDSSALPFEENVKTTKEVVRMAKAFGVDIEAELGKVDEAGNENLEKDVFTNVNQSMEFISRTGIDALAIAIGNKHGKYTTAPCLNIQRLQEIHNCNDLPLVLHGGSGTSTKDLKACVHNGIAKINVATAIQICIINEVRRYVQFEEANYTDMKQVIINASRMAVAHHIKLFESNNRC